MKPVGRDLSGLLDLLKSKGVASFSGKLEGESVSVAFHAERPVPLPQFPTQLGEQPVEAELCACGHELIGEHNHEGCLRGCDAEECAPKKTKRKGAK